MGARCRANAASGAASIVVDAVTRPVSITLRRSAGRELIARTPQSPASDRTCGAIRATAHGQLRPDKDAIVRQRASRQP
ncbi:MAG: hypothetical protein QOF30_198 [Acidimicrobiaceae bacterium]|jgi:hypothetical protein|nr:hypothetical protein [Acidimicrobiaceae bacterium]